MIFRENSCLFFPRARIYIFFSYILRAAYNFWPTAGLVWNNYLIYMKFENWNVYTKNDLHKQRMNLLGARKWRRRIAKLMTLKIHRMHKEKKPYTLKIGNRDLVRFFVQKTGLRWRDMSKCCCPNLKDYFTWHIKR